MALRFLKCLKLHYIFGYLDFQINILQFPMRYFFTLFIWNILRGFEIKWALLRACTLFQFTDQNENCVVNQILGLTKVPKSRLWYTRR